MKTEISITVKHPPRSQCNHWQAYTFSGGSFLFRILSPFPPKFSKAGVLRILNSSMKNGRNRKLLPSRTSHKSVPAVSERFSLSTPDQTVSVNPCVLQSGHCD